MGMSLLALILRSLSSSMIQPVSGCPALMPSTTTTPTPSPSSCTTKWIIARSRPEKSPKKPSQPLCLSLWAALARRARRRGAGSLRLFLGAIGAAPFPGLERVRIRPEAEPRLPGSALRGIEGFVRRIEVRDPRHAAAHLLRIRVDRLAGDAREQ